ncbi:hypothetical protein FACS1894152_1760 [Bacilli bacterium]|nr:hypothetical protein FACS1894152_1760 [Bacilli bacterium]
MICDGFSDWKDGRIWTNDNEAQIRINNGSLKSPVLSFVLVSRTQKMKMVEFSVNGEILRTLDLDKIKDGERISIALPKTDATSQIITIRLIKSDRPKRTTGYLIDKIRNEIKDKIKNKGKKRRGSRKFGIRIEKIFVDEEPQT